MCVRELCGNLGDNAGHVRVFGLKQDIEDERAAELLAVAEIEIGSTLPQEIRVLRDKPFAIPAHRGHHAVLHGTLPMEKPSTVLAKRITVRRHSRGKPVPVLMLTTLGADTDIVRGFKHGADDYLLKPFTPYDLMTRVHNLLRL